MLWAPTSALRAVSTVAKLLVVRQSYTEGGSVEFGLLLRKTKQK